MKERIVLSLDKGEYLGIQLGWKIILRFEHKGTGFGQFEGQFTFYTTRATSLAQAEREAKVEFLEYIKGLSQRLEPLRQKI